MAKAMGTDPVLLDLAQKVREVMKHKNLSQGQIIKRSGVSPSTLNELLYARRAISLESIRKIMDATRVKYEILVITNKGKPKIAKKKRPGVKPKHVDPDKPYYHLEEKPKPPKRPTGRPRTKPAKQTIRPINPFEIWDEDVDIFG